MDKIGIQKPASNITAAAFLLLLLGIPGCASKTKAEEAGIDQEITRNIMWRYREDSAKRFADVRVTCENREILIEGRVTDPKAASVMYLDLPAIVQTIRSLLPASERSQFDANTAPDLAPLRSFSVDAGNHRDGISERVLLTLR